MTAVGIAVLKELTKPGFLDEVKEKASLLTAENLAAARKAAANSMTLLKNTDNLLPLKSPKSILVLGHLAESQNDVLDFW